jgi:heme oxygenase
MTRMIGSGVAVVMVGVRETSALSARLRDRIRPLHEAGEPVYLRLLMAGVLDPAEYAALLAQYHVIYSALERAALAVGDDPVAERFAALGRGRVAELEADLGTVLGAKWRDTGSFAPGEPCATVVCAATLAYQERIMQAASWPGGFIAHHYVRYLADLSGGQLISQTLARVYGPLAADLRFHSLPASADITVLKRDYRALLDATEWTDAERDRIAAEAVAAYRLNTQVLDELGTHLANGWAPA